MLRIARIFPGLIACLIGLTPIVAPLSSMAAPPGCAATISVPEDARIGMLVKLTDGREVLVMDHYLLVKHEELFNWIEDQYGVVQKIIWSGELEVKNATSPDPQIVRANETSSFAQAKVKQNDPRAPGPNPVRALETFLNKHPGSKTSNAEFWAFDKRNERIDIEFQSLGITDVRHELGTLVSNVY